MIGGGPSGSCAAEIFAQEPNIDTYMFERKMDNCKPCGGAIPLCMVEEFQLPINLIDRKVRGRGGERAAGTARGMVQVRERDGRGGERGDQ